MNLLSLILTTAYNNEYRLRRSLRCTCKTSADYTDDNAITIVNGDITREAPKFTARRNRELLCVAVYGQEYTRHRVCLFINANETSTRTHTHTHTHEVPCCTVEIK